LEPLNSPEIHREIKDWALGGKLYLDFLNIVAEASVRLSRDFILSPFFF
jgi:hypothetical protein